MGGWDDFVLHHGGSTIVPWHKRFSTLRAEMGARWRRIVASESPVEKRIMNKLF